MSEIFAVHYNGKVISRGNCPKNLWPNRAYIYFRKATANAVRTRLVNRGYNPATLEVVRYVPEQELAKSFPVE